ncbi:MAG: hypothetical protein OXI24_12335 [Candidatus Poribacteria bacterium]|nr:hypothetical protein [Candidatus Poribacteria bacterium]
MLSSSRELDEDAFVFSRDLITEKLWTQQENGRIQGMQRERN